MKMRSAVVALLCGAAVAASDPCDELASDWVSDPYSGERIDSNGNAKTFTNLEATFKIKSQHGCAFEGYLYNSTNGAAARKNWVAGVILGTTMGVVELQMFELGGSSSKGSWTARVDATISTDGILRWRHTGRGSGDDESWVVVFDAVFAVGAAPGLGEPDCANVSGVWFSDWIEYDRLYWWPGRKSK